MTLLFPFMCSMLFSFSRQISSSISVSSNFDVKLTITTSDQ
jgi:hypothetical protein